MQTRTSELEQWLQQLFESAPMQLTLLQGDASFRRYFRLTLPDNLSYIVMDAPPAQEAVRPFLNIAASLIQHGIRAPRIMQSNLQAGFVLLEDFGDTLLLQALQHPDTHAAPDALYSQALDTLQQFQTWKPTALCLPSFDTQHMLRELSLFKDWFLDAYLKVHLTAQETNALHAAFTCITERIAAQPIVPIHRDFHARNLMLLEDETLSASLSMGAPAQQCWARAQPTGEKTGITLGVIDFQDAMMGPVAYDLVSLLKDCYIQWPQAQIDLWMTQFYKQAPIAQTLSPNAFRQAFDWCGIQRHLKVLGIFSRLYLRDNKSGYLQDMPLTLKHLTNALTRYPELSELQQLIKRHCSPCRLGPGPTSARAISQHP